MRARVTITKDAISIKVKAYGKTIVNYTESLVRYSELYHFVKWLLVKTDRDSIELWNLRYFKRGLTTIANLRKLLTKKPVVFIYGIPVGRKQVQQFDLAKLRRDAIALRRRLTLKNMSKIQNVVCFAEVEVDEVVRETSADRIYQLIAHGYRHFVNYETFERDGRFIALKTKNSIIVADKEDLTITFIGFHDWCSDETIYMAIEWLQKKIGEMSEYLVETIVKWIAEKSRSEEAEALLGLLYAASQ